MARRSDREWFWMATPGTIPILCRHRGTELQSIQTEVAAYAIRRSWQALKDGLGGHVSHRFRE